MGSSRTKVALLTTGTEIMTGQILNTNQQSLAQWLSDMGFEMRLHISVGDEFESLIAAIDDCCSHADLIIVTGGLGPTSDDLTRSVIAHWSERPLEFDPETWERITNKLNTAGVEIAESNRVQAHFPGGAELLFNHRGTADGFAITHRSKRIICLPGPPRELLNVWQQQVYERLNNWYDLPPPEQLRRFHCLGKSESALAEIIESAMTDCGLTLGYRPHPPFVEVKIWLPHKPTKSSTEYLIKLRTAIEPWLCSVDDQDHGRDFWATAKFRHIAISGDLTAGYLGMRLSEFIPSGASMTISTTDSPKMSGELQPDLFISMTQLDQVRWNLELRHQGQTTLFEESLPFQQTPDRKVRSQKYLAERILWLLQEFSQ
jgi:nicotinamide-nucleotide amidase